MLPRQAIVGGQHVIGAEAQVDGAHLLKAAQQKAGRCQQHQGDREFGNHQGRAQARVAASGSAGTAALFQCFVDVGARRGHRRNQPAEQPVSSTNPSANATTRQSRPMESRAAAFQEEKLTPARSATHARANPMRPLPGMLSIKTSTRD